jgi:hypothetical protein
LFKREKPCQAAELFLPPIIVGSCVATVRDVL